MVRPAQTARSERTREALRQAAVVRFLAQGVEETSAEQIAADAGVSLRTFYRHFASKHDLLFADYDAGLHWFRSRAGGRARPTSRSSSRCSRRSWRARTTTGPSPRSPRCAPRNSTPAGSCGTSGRSRPTSPTPSRSTSRGDDPPKPGTDERMRITVTARCIAAAVFGAMEVWMLGEDRSLPELDAAVPRRRWRRCRTGIGDPE